MKKRKLFLVLVALSLTAALAALLWTPGRTPAGQPPLVTLYAAATPEFTVAFDDPPPGPRLVLLVSPT